MLCIDRTSATPLTDQIVDHLSRAIHQGELQPGDRLPSIRQMAARLGVSPFTIAVAYDKLTAAGLTNPKSAVGNFVSLRRSESFTVESAPEAPPALLPDGSPSNCSVDVGAGWIDASCERLPPHWFDNTVISGLVQKLLRGPGGGMQEATVHGSIELREAICRQLHADMIYVQPRSILVTSNSLQTIDLICQALLGCDDLVVVEDPCAPMLIARLIRHGARVLTIPRLADGPDIEALQRICESRSPRIVFTQSVLNNPTGLSSSGATLHRLLNLAERYGFMIAEEDEFGDMASRPQPRVAQLSDLRHVIYCSSFGRIVGAGLELAFIAANPRIVAALAEAKLNAAVGGFTLQEGLILNLLASGRYRKHQNRLRLRIVAARSSAQKSLAQIGFRFDPLAEGLYLWGRLPEGVGGESLAQDAANAKILLATDSAFRPSRAASVIEGERLPTHIRFNVATSNNARLIEFLRVAIRRGENSARRSTPPT